MNENSNMRNQRLIPFTIADLALMAEAGRHGAATALCYGSKGKGSIQRFRQIADMFEKLCPVPLGCRGEEYAWFDAFTQVETAQAFSVFLQTRKKYSWNHPDVAMVIMVVDSKTFELTDELELDNKEIPEAYLKMCAETLELAKEAAPLDAELMKDFAACLPVKIVETDANRHIERGKLRQTAATNSVTTALGEDGTSLPFYVKSVETAWSAGDDHYDCVILIRPSDERKFADAFGDTAKSVPSL